MEPIPTQIQQEPVAQDPDTRFYRAILHELIELGTDLARDVHAQARRDTQARCDTQARRDTRAHADDPAAPRPDHTIAFERVARTVRRTILMAQHIARPANRPANHPADHDGQTRLQARRHIIRKVEDTITRTHPSDGAALLAEFRERLDAPELAESLDGDIATRPVPEIVAEIVHDLGLLTGSGPEYWRRRTPADLKRLDDQAAGRGLPRAAEPPYAGHHTGPTPPRPQTRP